MKTIFKTLVIGIISCLSFSTFAQIGDGIPMTVCQIVIIPVDELDVITVGEVSNAFGDQFELTYDGCTILCDVTTGNIPLAGMFIALDGRIQEEDIFEDLKIQVRYWTPYYEPPPDYPDPIVFSVEDAIDSELGTVALLFGKVVSFSDEGEGIGTFIDDTASIAIDFMDGDSPAIQQNIYVLGVVEENNASNPEIEVIYWYPEGGDPPPPPRAVAWSIEDINTLPLGSICFILGSMTSWTDITEGKGVYNDSENTIGIDFEDDVPLLPELTISVFVFGESTEDEGVRVITSHAWIEEDGLLGVDDPIYLAHLVMVYPNPVTDILNIEADMEIKTVKIYSLQGQLIKENLRSSIDVSQLSAGLYFVQVISDGIIFTKKFIKN